MKTRYFLTVFLFLGGFLLGGMEDSRGQTTSAEFLFMLRSAAKTHDKYGIAACFNSQGTDAETKNVIRRTIEQIVTWPDPYVFTTERKDRGALIFERGGKSYTLNGDWTFQVHIHRSGPSSQGYVFPAGLTSSGKCRILLAVRK